MGFTMSIEPRQDWFNVLIRLFYQSIITPKLLGLGNSTALAL